MKQSAWLTKFFDDCQQMQDWMAWNSAWLQFEAYMRWIKFRSEIRQRNTK